MSGVFYYQGAVNEANAKTEKVDEEIILVVRSCHYCQRSAAMVWADDEAFVRVLRMGVAIKHPIRIGTIAK